MGRVANAGQGVKRSRILDAAEDVFARRGFHRARVTDIAHLAGVADGTIYLYFKNKDDLLVSLFEDRMGRIIQSVAALLDEYAGARERLTRFAEFYLTLAESEVRLAEVLAVELRASTAFMKEYKNVKFLEFLGLVARIIREGQDEGEIRRDMNPDLVARALFGALDELVLGHIMARRKPYTLQDVSNQIQTLFWSGLTAECEPPLVESSAVEQGRSPLAREKEEP